MRFDQDYQEELVLRDGSRARLRLLHPGDKVRLQEGLKLLSLDSVVARFFTVKRNLTSRELRYLTEVDGYDHFAIGAVLINEDGTEGAGLGVGRFVRDPHNPISAEPAVVVLDAWQNQGVGRVIFDRLVAAAQERSIRSFHTEFLPGNEGIQRLLTSICPELMIWRRGELLVADVPLPDLDDEDRKSESKTLFATLLRLAARNGIRVRRLGSRSADESGDASAGQNAGSGSGRPDG